MHHLPTQHTPLNPRLLPSLQNPHILHPPHPNPHTTPKIIQRLHNPMSTSHSQERQSRIIRPSDRSLDVSFGGNFNHDRESGSDVAVPALCGSVETGGAGEVDLCVGGELGPKVLVIVAIW